MTPTPIPHGYIGWTPFLVVDGAAAAIEFYTDVFGAVLTEKMLGPDGTVVHAELDFGHGRLQLSDPNPAYRLEAPGRSGRMTHSIVFYCADVDDVLARSQNASATLREPAPTFVTGDRFGAITDPFGQRWSIMTRVEDVDASETRTPAGRLGCHQPVTGQRPTACRTRSPRLRCPPRPSAAAGCSRAF